ARGPRANCDVKTGNVSRSDRAEALRRSQRGSALKPSENPPSGPKEPPRASRHPPKLARTPLARVARPPPQGRARKRARRAYPASPWPKRVPRELPGSLHSLSPAAREPPQEPGTLDMYRALLVSCSRFFPRDSAGALLQKRSQVTVRPPPAP